MRLSAIEASFLERWHDQLGEILKRARACERVKHVATGARDASMLLDSISSLFGRTYQDQISTSCDVGKALPHITRCQRLTASIRTHHVGSQAFSVS
ncbi:hypothetical protein O999_18770 [Pseudomonas putida LF54]|nr:hypothetical protein O999_18770 [Pseudomonas putida LF54]